MIWLLRCSDNGDYNIDLTSREARQLGNLVQEGDIDRAIGKKANRFSLWMQLLAAVNDIYPFRDGTECHLSKWTVLGKGIN